MMDTQNYYTADFKAKVMLEALRGEKSMAELALEFAVGADQISLWKQQLFNNLHKAFENDMDSTDDKPLRTVELRHATIGQLMAENDFLTKVLGR